MADAGERQVYADDADTVRRDFVEDANPCRDRRLDHLARDQLSGMIQRKSLYLKSRLIKTKPKVYFAFVRNQLACA